MSATLAFNGLRSSLVNSEVFVVYKYLADKNKLIAENKNTILLCTMLHVYFKVPKPLHYTLDAISASITYVHCCLWTFLCRLRWDEMQFEMLVFSYQRFPLMRIFHEGTVLIIVYSQFWYYHISLNPQWCKEHFAREIFFFFQKNNNNIFVSNTG